MTTLKVGSVAALHRYPVKSMMGEELNATRIGTKGVAGDRAFALADPETGKIAVAPRTPSKMAQPLSISRGLRAASWLNRAPCRR